MRYEIWGEICPAVTVKLKKGECIYTQQGGISWMTDQIQVDTSVRSKQKKTFADYLKRNSEFAAEYRALEDNQEITISATRAGRIIVFDIKPGYSVIGRRMRFLCSEENVTLHTIIPTYNKHLPNGSGYYLQSYEGEGRVFMEMSGSVKVKELEEGERLVVESGNLGAWESTVKVTEQFSRDFQSMLFNGEGTLMSVVEGPGKVWLMTAPFSELSKRIIPFIKDVD